MSSLGDIGGQLAHALARIGLAPKWLGTAAVIAVAAVAAGCGHASLTPLPDLAKLPSDILSADQQKAAIKEMTELRVKHETQTIDAIEKAR